MSGALVDIVDDLSDGMLATHMCSSESDVSDNDRIAMYVQVNRM